MKLKLNVFLILLIFGALTALAYCGSDLLGDKLLSNSINSDNPDAKISYLMASDFFDPNNAKKIQIVTSYYRRNNPEKAEFWLKKMSGQERSFVLAGYYLEMGDGQMAEVYINRIANQSVKKELMTYKEFLETGRAIVGSYITDYGLVMGKFSGGEALDNKDSYSYILSLLQKNPAEDLKSKLILSGKLIEINQPKLALALLNQEKTNHYNAVPLYLISADAYLKTGDRALALKEYQAALKINPTNIEVYKKVIPLATGQEKAQLQEKLDMLEKIKG